MSQIADFALLANCEYLLRHRQVLDSICVCQSSMNARVIQQIISREPLIKS